MFIKGYTFSLKYKIQPQVSYIQFYTRKMMLLRLVIKCENIFKLQLIYLLQPYINNKIFTMIFAPFFCSQIERYNYLHVFLLQPYDNILTCILTEVCIIRHLTGAVDCWRQQIPGGSPHLSWKTYNIYFLITFQDM